MQEIANELGIKVSEVRSRIAKLEKSGAILGYQAILDPEKTANGSVTAVIEALAAVLAPSPLGVAVLPR